jgi:hypothetical protein
MTTHANEATLAIATVQLRGAQKLAASNEKIMATIAENYSDVLKLFAAW